jgi:hypothetical protein
MVGGWRRLHNEELYNLFTSQNISMIKSRRIRSARHVACIGEMRNVDVYKVLIGKPEGRHHSKT